MRPENVQIAPARNRDGWNRRNFVLRIAGSWQQKCVEFLWIETCETEIEAD